MILDRLEQADRYANLNPGFPKAFAFLRKTDLRTLPLGRHEIDGERVYAMVSRSAARPREEARLEAHRRYIDIQYVISGVEEMGWRSRARCVEPRGAYDSEKDVQFFADAADAWIAVGPGAFVVFFPEDAHAPLVGRGELHKVVVKVAAEWKRRSWPVMTEQHGSIRRSGRVGEDADGLNGVEGLVG